jgi:predicted metalloprotease
MRWEGGEESSNVEDMRGSSGGGGGGFGIGGGSLGIGAIVIALVGGAIFGINPLTILSLLEGGGSAPPAHVQPAPPQHTNAAEEKKVQFVKVVLRDTEVVWTKLFQAGGATYHPPKLDLYRGQLPTACGLGSAGMGPFYCPADQKVYLDLSFYDELTRRFGAPGDFAQAYVIAHEIGHHVQNELGISRKVDAARSRMSRTQANALSVRVELQADCFAGVWGHWSQQSKGWLDPGDIESAMNAAAKIGDDALQRSAGRAVVPDSFTHGSSAQRQKWFMTGYQTGSVKACDTFNAASL